MARDQGFRVTYATLSADSEDLHKAFEAAIARVEKNLGSTFPMYIGGEARRADATFADSSPINTDIVLGHFQKGSRKEAALAVAAARAAWADWHLVSWQERCRIMNRAADLIGERRDDFAAMMVYEMGKNRVEALGEAEESADLFRYYAHQMELNNGFERTMGQLATQDCNTSVMRPYGVWAVVVPFNFPLALAAGPVGAALVTGNTVVMKPSSETPWTGLLLYQVLVEAGVPAGALNFLTGTGETVGQELIDNSDVDGITFTGSYGVGFSGVYQKFSRQWPKPCVIEMGGKNPAIVARTADLEKAAMGVMRSAFGMGGQKCSACSRVYVHNTAKEAFVSQLIQETQAIKIGNPIDRDTFLGPLVHKRAYQDYQRFIAHARQDGDIVYGGNVLTDGEFGKGYYVEPAIVEGLPEDHPLVKEELFVPILTVAGFDTLDEALGKANAVKYGLTAGFFSQDQSEIDTFLDRIQAGVLYVNRPAGATTGAWPGVQPFGGWKASGSTGKNIGGYYTLLCYLREQSQTIVQ